MTFAFFLDPVVPIASLKDMFAHDKLDEALEIIQSSVRKQLRSSLEIIESSFHEQLGLSSEVVVGMEWIIKGTKDWDCSKAFVFGEKELEIHFAQYEVAGYAAGPQSATINYEQIVSMMRREYVDALDIAGPLWAAEGRRPKNFASARAAPPVAAPDAAT